MVVTGPSCRMQLGGRLVGFSHWMELPYEGGMWHGISVAWEEPPGTDVAIRAIAQRPESRWEQLRILHSLH